MVKKGQNYSLQIFNNFFFRKYKNTAPHKFRIFPGLFLSITKKKNLKNNNIPTNIYFEFKTIIIIIIKETGHFKEV